MKLTSSNYFSREAMMKYMSVSQLKGFIGCNAISGCEEREMAILNGTYVPEKSDALTVGSYVDVALTGTKKQLEKFIATHPDMFSSRGATKGQLKSTYQIADKMIERAKRDAVFMKTLKGKHQNIMTGEIYGVPFKIKTDVLNLDKGFITDLKTTESIHKTFYRPSDGKHISFIEHWDYILQGAIYREIVRQNTGKELPFFISAISKEKHPEIAVIQIDNQTLKEKLESLEDVIPAVQMVKTGQVPPTRCECCDYCKDTFVLEKPISYLELGGDLN